MKTERCENCRFWKEGYHRPDDYDGECRKHCPVIVQWRDNNYGDWPPTKKDDWCGEHEKEWFMTVDGQRE